VLSHLGPGINNLSTSNLFDVWLRIQDGPSETRKAAESKNYYGYDTDAYYPFTTRDQSMIADTRAALREYFDRLSDIDLCLYDPSYSPPDDQTIINMLNGG
jgi:hypothetical protein